jgi:MoaA/NifB/PqqE/SkfB family radical SAM enzyme
MNRKKAVTPVSTTNESKDDYFLRNANSNFSVKTGVYTKEEYCHGYREYRDKWILAAGVRGGEASKPLCLDLEVASLCDLACPFCYRQQVVTPDKLIDQHVADNALESALKMRIPSIKFNWRGEPLLNKNLEDYILRAKQGGVIETLINTNALSLSGTRAESLIRSGLDTMIYSFDGGTSETYEKNRPGRFKKNDFKRVVENIKLFKSVRDEMSSSFPYTRIQMILTQESRDEIDEFYELFSPYVDEVSTKQYTERGGNLNVLNDDERVLIENYARKVGRNASDIGYMIVDDKVYVATGRLPCQQPFQRLLVTYEGRVGMCCYDWGATYAVGTINKQIALNAQKDYDSVKKNIDQRKRSFRNMKAEINQDFEILHSVPSSHDLRSIWEGPQIERVRQLHMEKRHADIEICESCTFKETYKWELLSK